MKLFKKRILVCEDDSGIADVLAIILKENGYQVQVLNSAKSIVKKIKQFDPHLILLDILMSGMDGMETTKVIKRDKSMGKIPIVVVSAIDNLKKTAASIGADDYIFKPFEVDKLLKTVAKHIKVN